MVFTVPALLFLAQGDTYFRYGQILTLAAVGGVLGILFMIPLRRSLIVKAVSYTHLDVYKRQISSWSETMIPEC